MHALIQVNTCKLVDHKLHGYLLDKQGTLKYIHRSKQ